jgi:hypothetical protein
MIQMEQWRDSLRHNQLSDVVRFGPILDHANFHYKLNGGDGS